MFFPLPVRIHLDLGLLFCCSRPNELNRQFAERFSLNRERGERCARFSCVICWSSFRRVSRNVMKCCTFFDAPSTSIWVDIALKSEKTQKSDEKFFYNTRMLFSYCKTGVFFTAMQSPMSPISDNSRKRMSLSPSRACSVRAARAPLTGSLHFLLSQVSPSPLG